MWKHTLTILAVIALSGCVAPTEQDESLDDKEDMGSTEEATISTACVTANMTEAAKKARTAINDIRTKAGMPAIKCDKKAQQATRNHAKYLSVYGAPGGDPHKEDPQNEPEFTGVTFGARMKAAGFAGQPQTEDISGDVSGDTTMWGLMDTVYHRAPFVSFWTRSYGFATKDTWAVIDFGNDDTQPSPDAWSVWPVANATGVNTTFNCDSEGPNPCPVGHEHDKVGYPISLSAGSVLSNVTVVITTKDGDNKDVVVPHFPKLMYAWDTQVYVLPRKPLANNTKYTVTMKGTQNKKSFTHTWSFKTKS